MNYFQIIVNTTNCSDGINYKVIYLLINSFDK